MIYSRRELENTDLKIFKDKLEANECCELGSHKDKSKILILPRSLHNEKIKERIIVVYFYNDMGDLNYRMDFTINDDIDIGIQIDEISNDINNFVIILDEKDGARMEQKTK